jgi:phospholipid/cholesterol/gamma-HCH transport system substrate-binding protein
MTKEQNVRLGVFILVATAAILVVLAVFLVPKIREEGEAYFVNFKDMSVGGLFPGSPVKYQGVDIGKVTRIHVNPEDLNSILVDIRIRRDFSIKQDMQAALVYIGITGMRSVELSGGSAASPELKPRGEIEMARGLGEKAEDIVANIDSAVRSINALLNEDNQEKITLFLKNVELSSGVLSSVLTDRKDNLEASIADIAAASAEFTRVAANLGKITDDMGKVTGVLESGTEEVLANLTRRLSDEEMGRVLTNLETFVATGNSSLKKIESVLLYQQEELNRMFASLGESLENLSRFSRELTQDPTIFLRTRKEKKK